jgi:hypothetical protein
MNAASTAHILALFFVGAFALDAPLSLDNMNERGISTVQPRNQAQVFLQSTDPMTGANVLLQKGSKYSIERDPANGLADLYPTPPPNFVTGVTPMHLSYQYLTRPQTIMTPLNMFNYPRVHVPVYGLEHPMNMHHPYNNIFGMHPQMYTGAASAQPHLFMNPAAYGKKLIGTPGSPFLTSNGLTQSPAVSPMIGGTAGPVGFSQQPGFNPNLSGIGPFGAGGAAFNPSQTSMGPWFYLSPFNSGQ